jgi:hypothetical protein
MVQLLFKVDWIGGRYSILFHEYSVYGHRTSRARWLESLQFQIKNVLV